MRKDVFLPLFIFFFVLINEIFVCITEGHDEKMSRTVLKQETWETQTWHVNNEYCSPGNLLFAIYGAATLAAKEASFGIEDVDVDMQSALQTYGRLRDSATFIFNDKILLAHTTNFELQDDVPQLHVFKIFPEGIGAALLWNINNIKHLMSQNKKKIALMKYNIENIQNINIEGERQADQDAANYYLIVKQQLENWEERFVACFCTAEETSEKDEQKLIIHKMLSFAELSEKTRELTSPADAESTKLFAPPKDQAVAYCADEDNIEGVDQTFSKSVYVYEFTSERTSLMSEHLHTFFAEYYPLFMAVLMPSGNPDRRMCDQAVDKNVEHM